MPTFRVASQGWSYDSARLVPARTGTSVTSPAASNSVFTPQAGPSGSDASRRDSDTAANRSSPYVPLDSWIYPVVDRLIAMGYIQTGSSSVRPLTRLECARLLAEAHTNQDDSNADSEALTTALDTEFSHETSVLDGGGNSRAAVESVYARYTGINGTPLRDSFHFGQTLADDYGRPYGKGSNGIAGFATYAEEGRFSIYARGEYQGASANPAYTPVAQAAINAADQLDEAWSNPNNIPLPANINLRTGNTSRIRPIEAYASVNWDNWQFSFGQQSLWWGPARSTSLIFSNNAESMPMLRIGRVKPIKMPGLLGWMGPVHFDSFFSRQGGIHFVSLGQYFTLTGSNLKPLTPAPFMWGVTFSLQPTENLEIGFSHSVIFAGYGRPLNLQTFIHSFSIEGNGQDVDPGKRVTQFNFYYHVPFLRKSVVVYTEGVAWDNPIEGSFFSRFAMDPGVYLPQLPGLKKMDLRLEGAYTDLPGLKEQAYYYANAHYVQGYTNYGQIIGSWVGRQGDGGQASTSYWFSPRTKVTATYRKTSSNKSFLQGGHEDDISANLTWTVRPNLEISAAGQYERWKFTQLAAGVNSDFTTTLQVKFFPKAHLGSR